MRFWRGTIAEGPDKPMKPALFLITLLTISLPAWTQSNEHDEGDQPDPPMLGPHMERGHANHGGGNSSNSPNMIYHNGQVLSSTVSATIFWGKNWANASFIGDKISGMDSWYQGVGSSTYARTSDEYSGTNGPVTKAITFAGHVVDTTAAPSHAPRTSTILNEVCTRISNPVANGYYAVYVDTPRGGAGYCAWHSWGTCGSVPVQFAFFFNLDGDPGCDPQSTVSGQSQGLAALANVSGHELSEARTDPRGTGWFDNSGQENGDKCAWAFGSPSVTFSNGTTWKIQGNWSNEAFTGGFGYLNNSGQPGCLDGQNYPAVAQ